MDKLIKCLNVSQDFIIRGGTMEFYAIDRDGILYYPEGVFKIPSTEDAVIVSNDPIYGESHICKDCKCNFILTEGEVKFFENKNLTKPVRCESCRQKRKGIRYTK